MALVLLQMSPVLWKGRINKFFRGNLLKIFPPSIRRSPSIGKQSTVLAFKTSTQISLANSSVQKIFLQWIARVNAFAFFASRLVFLSVCHIERAIKPKKMVRLAVKMSPQILKLLRSVPLSRACLALS